MTITNVNNNKVAFKTEEKEHLLSLCTHATSCLRTHKAIQ